MAAIGVNLLWCVPGHVGGSEEYVTRALAPRRCGGRVDAEKARCLTLIDQIATKNIGATGWGRSSLLGQMSGHDWSRLQAKHLNHHLKQFSV